MEFDIVSSDVASGVTNLNDADYIA